MKKFNLFFALNNTVKSALLLMFLLSGLSSVQKERTKITVCHLPPGNPENRNLITISENALQAHLAHGDKVICSDVADYQNAVSIIGFNSDQIIKIWELKNQTQIGSCY